MLSNKIGWWYWSAFEDLYSTSSVVGKESGGGKTSHVVHTHTLPLLSCFKNVGVAKGDINIFYWQARIKMTRVDQYFGGKGLISSQHFFSIEKAVFIPQICAMFASRWSAPEPLAGVVPVLNHMTCSQSIVLSCSHMNSMTVQHWVVNINHNTSDFESKIVETTISMIQFKSTSFDVWREKIISCQSWQGVEAQWSELGDEFGNCTVDLVGAFTWPESELMETKDGRTVREWITGFCMLFMLANCWFSIGFEIEINVGVGYVEKLGNYLLTDFKNAI